MTQARRNRDFKPKMVRMFWHHQFVQDCYSQRDRVWFCKNILLPYTFTLHLSYWIKHRNTVIQSYKLPPSVFWASSKCVFYIKQVTALLQKTSPDTVETAASAGKLTPQQLNDNEAQDSCYHETSDTRFFKRRKCWYDSRRAAASGRCHYSF